MTPRPVLRRLRQSIAEWPTGRTDGTLAVLWSLAAWVFVLAAVVLVGVALADAGHRLTTGLTASLLHADGTVLLQGLAAVFLLSCLLVTYRVGYWRGQRALRRRNTTVPTSHVFLQPDPHATRSDRIAGGVWLYLGLLLVSALLGL